MNSDLFERLYKDLHKYVNAASYSFASAFRHLERDDLAQEVWEHILDIMVKYEKKPYAELVYLCKASVYNILRDRYRRERIRKSVPFNYSDEQYDDLLAGNTENADAVLRLAFELSEKGDVVSIDLLSLMIEPDERLMRIVLDGSTGSRVRITLRHYAVRLSVSVATISRLMTAIRRRLEEIRSE